MWKAKRDSNDEPRWRGKRYTLTKNTLLELNLCGVVIFLYGAEERYKHCLGDLKFIVYRFSEWINFFRGKIIGKSSK